MKRFTASIALIAFASLAQLCGPGIGAIAVIIAVVLSIYLNHE